jgi:amino acid transporter
VDEQDEGTRLDRELIELLNELRVVLPGVQVMFAFLLVVPFSQRFGVLDGRERAIFFVAFLASAIASVFLIAPSTHHRIQWRRYDKERLLRRANRLAILATAALAIAIVAVVYLIAGVLYGDVSAVAAGATAGLIAWTWFAYPLMRRAGAR